MTVGSQEYLFHLYTYNLVVIFIIDRGHEVNAHGSTACIFTMWVNAASVNRCFQRSYKSHWLTILNSLIVMSPAQNNTILSIGRRCM